MRQYQKIFAMDGNELTLTKEALAAITTRAQSRKTGARGLHSILEEVMLDIMFDLPSLTNVKKCIISKEVIDGLQQPALIPGTQQKDVPA